MERTLRVLLVLLGTAARFVSALKKALWRFMDISEPHPSLGHATLQATLLC
jgi:hypothetical protein